MRVDLCPIIECANSLIAAIEAKSQSRSRSGAHKLLCALPDPTWAETAPGCTIYLTHVEAEMNENLNVLRSHAMRWMDWLLSEGLLDNPEPEWPEPKRLAQAIQVLRGYMPQNASVSANTAPTAS